MSEFIFSCDLGNRIALLNCITYEQYKALTKIVLNNDIKAFDSFWDKLLPGFNVIEKVIALIDIKDLSVGTSLSLTHEQKTYQVNTAEIQTKLRALLTIPRNSYASYFLIARPRFAEKFENLQQGLIESHFEVSDSKFWSEVDVTVYKKLREEFKHLENHINSIELIPNFKLSLLDNSLWLLVKFLFEDNYLNLLNLDLSILKNLKWSLADVNKMTYQEVNLLIKMNNAEVEKENKKHEQFNPFQPSNNLR